MNINEIKIKDGDFCKVVAGTHKGKSEIAGEINLSKSGHVTLTIIQNNGIRFKTLQKNVVISKDN